MKYVVLKNSRNMLCVQLPEGFGTKLEIVCFEKQAEFNDFLETNPVGACQISFSQMVPKTEEEECSSILSYDGLFVRQNEYYNRILFADNSRVVVTYPMSEVKKKLPPELFI